MTELAGYDVPRVGYGAMQLAERIPPVERDRAVDVLRRAVQLGVRHVDTAPFYGAGLADELIRSALAPYPADLALVSKVGARRTPDGTLVPAQRPAELRAAVEAELHALDVERLAVVNLRRLDSAPGIVATGEQLVDLDDQLAELDALRSEGKLAGIGLSQVDAQQLRRALPVGLACVQNLFNLLERDAEPLLELCRAHDVRWVPFFPLGSAFPGRARVDRHPDVLAVAARRAATPAQVGLAWLLAHDPNTLLIPGTADLGHLAENVAAADLVLGPDELALLDNAAASTRPVG